MPAIARTCDAYQIKALAKGFRMVQSLAAENRRVFAQRQIFVFKESLITQLLTKIKVIN